MLMVYHWNARLIVLVVQYFLERNAKHWFVRVDSLIVP